MSKKMHDFLNKTRSKAKKLRNQVKKLKKDQVAQQKHFHQDLKKVKAPPPEPKKEHLVVEFSMASVAKATLVILGLLGLAYFLVRIQDILMIVFVSFFLAAALDSIVDKLEEKRIPRTVSILGIYVVFFLFFLVFISTLIPLIATQIIELASSIVELIRNIDQESFWNFPYADRLQELVNDFLESTDQDVIISNLETGAQKLVDQLQSIADNTWDAIKMIFNGLFNAILIMVLTFFMVVDERGIEEFIISLFPSKHAKYIVAKSDAVKEKVGYWLRGQIKLMFAMALLTFVVLSIFGVDYALTLALIAGMMELLPVVGAIVAMIPALLIGLNESLAYAFWIFILYMIIQQIEGNILVPLIMKQAVGLSPIIIIVVMLIGYSFLGIAGVIISVPVATAVSIFIKDYTAKPK